jgi:hypothetical protein
MLFCSFLFGILLIRPAYFVISNLQEQKMNELVFLPYHFNTDLELLSFKTPTNEP